MRFESLIRDLFIVFGDTGVKGIEDVIRSFLSAHSIIIAVRDSRYACDDIAKRRSTEQQAQNTAPYQL